LRNNWLMSHDKHHGHGEGHKDKGKCKGSGKAAAGKDEQSFGTNDTGRNEQKEWMDGLSDDE